LQGALSVHNKLVGFMILFCLVIAVLLVSCADTAGPLPPAEGTPQAVTRSSQEVIEEMNEQVSALVILRNASGRSILDAEEPITMENEAKYQVESKIIDEVSSELERLGIMVAEVGPHTLSISADKGVFETVFETSLEKQSSETMGTKAPGVEASFYVATTPIKVPQSLSSRIAAVDLETPVEYFP
jgi:hypothetical protein